MFINSTKGRFMVDKGGKCDSIELLAELFSKNKIGFFWSKSLKFLKFYFLINLPFFQDFEKMY